MSDLIIKETEQLKDLDESKAKQIKAVFAPMVEMLEGFEKEYKNVMSLEISPDKCKEAKTLRIAISKVRIEADKVRKSQKEEYLRAGNAIQGVYNILKFAVVDKEDKLKEIENHFERIEEEKKEALATARIEELEKYEVDGSTMDLGNMASEVWVNFLSGTKGNYEAVKEAERKAEEERIEEERKENLAQSRYEKLLPFSDFTDFSVLTVDTSEEEFSILFKNAENNKSEYEAEQEKIKAENERLRIEAEKAEKQRIAEKKKQDEKLKAEREKSDRERKIQDEKLRKEREAREKLERESREKEAREKSEREKAEKAPDKEKLFSVAKKLRNTKTTVKNKFAIQALEDAAALLDKVARGM